MSTSPPIDANGEDDSKSDEDLDPIQDPQSDLESEGDSPKASIETNDLDVEVNRDLLQESSIETSDLDVEVNRDLLQESGPIPGENIEFFERKWTVWGRMLLGGSMILILAGTISLTLLKGWVTGWEETYEAFQFIFPAITGLIGSVMGFYFGTFEANNVASARKASIRKTGNKDS